jgi:hypothetical protein
MSGYRIVVRGKVSAVSAEAFDDLHVESESGQTVLTGEIVDQAHLYGILERLRGLGVELIALTPSNPDRGPREQGMTPGSTR